MKVFTYSEARQRLADLLNLAQKETVEIVRRDGSSFLLRAKAPTKTSSPFDTARIQDLHGSLTRSDILEAIEASRRRD